MKKFVAILFCTLLPLCALHSEDFTKNDLQNREGPWVCLKGTLDRNNNNITLDLEENENNAFLERVKDKYYLFSRADSIFVDGLYLKIDLVSKDKACLLDRAKKDKKDKIKPISSANTRLPRLLALKNKTEDNNNQWIFDLQINDESNPPKCRRVVILREWPHACPACSLVFSMADNPSLTKDSIFVASGDTSYIYRNSEDPLILSSIKVTKDKKGKFIRIDKIIINGKDGEISYKTKESQEEVTKDAYTLDCYAEISVDKKVQNIESIQVEYSYLDENLNEVPDTIDIRPDIETPQQLRRSSLPPINWEAIICCLLFVLTLLASGTLIWLLRAKNEAPKSPGPDNDGPVSASRQTQANHSEQILTGEQRQKQEAAEAQQQAMLNKLKQEKNALTQENESLRKENNDLQAKNSELQANYSGLQANHNELQASYSELQARISILQASYDDLQANYKQKASLLIEAAQKAFGEMPEDAKLTDFITQKGEEFKGLQCELEQLAQQMEAENAKHKAELERLWEEFKKKHQELIAAHQEDTRLYRDAQLALLNQMKAAYERCSGGAIPSSKFGKYVLSISESLSSFVKTGETLFQEATDEDSIASLSEKFSPTLRKALNDHTSWLNALVGLEAYARTEVLRKPMLEDGLDLSSLTEFFYATQELLKSNFYTINPLPALFVDTAPGDDYIRDNMDSKTSNLFDYEKVLKTSAIVDIIKIGYSYKNSAPTQTTINYYEKPREI